MIYVFLRTSNPLRIFSFPTTDSCIVALFGSNCTFLHCFPSARFSSNLLHINTIVIDEIFWQFIHNNYFGSDYFLQKVLEERAEQVAKLAKERQERDREERRKYVVQ